MNKESAIAAAGQLARKIIRIQPEPEIDALDRHAVELKKIEDEIGHLNGQMWQSGITLECLSRLDSLYGERLNLRADGIRQNRSLVILNRFSRPFLPRFI